jgi:hypothetical protein
MILEQFWLIWRLNLQRPKSIMLGLDVMPMNNDDALCREKVQPTYKNYKGFEPLNLNWDRMLVGANLRPGKDHSLGGGDARSMIIRDRESDQETLQPGCSHCDQA